MRSLRGSPGVFLALLLVIWIGLPLFPEDTGVRFGMGYRVFFTVMLFLSGLLFWLLGKETVPLPRSTAGVVGSVTAVFLVTVGLLVVAGLVYPQFELPQAPEAVSEDAAERGKGLFLSSNVGCFRCHTIKDVGGPLGRPRGPDLTEVASRAGGRVSGLTAEEYLPEKIRAGKTYKFTVPDYTPIMPEFGQLLTDEQMDDLVTFLLSLE